MGRRMPISCMREETDSQNHTHKKKSENSFQTEYHGMDTKIQHDILKLAQTTTFLIKGLKSTLHYAPYNFTVKTRHFNGYKFSQKHAL